MGERVCILTSVHPPFDPRIFQKEARTLVRAGYDVSLVAQHRRDEVVDGVRIIPLPKPGNRFWRILGGWRVFRLACRQEAAVYHFHDPELIPVGLLLKLTKRGQVVYDVHENYVTSIRQKDYVPRPIRGPAAFAFGVFERWSSRFFHVILAERYYRSRFERGSCVLNYPVIELLSPTTGVEVPTFPQPRLLYTGNVTIDRGALTHASILSYVVDVHLCVAGMCTPELARRMHSSAGSGTRRLHVLRVGEPVPYGDILALYGAGGWLAGLALFPPTPHYMEKQLTKMFEYMAAGMPVIASDFSSWREIVEGNDCGIVVNPLEPKHIAEAIQHLIDHPDEATRMGANGKKAVLEKYNWDSESKRLLAIYEELLKEEGSGG